MENDELNNIDLVEMYEKVAGFFKSYFKLIFGVTVLFIAISIGEFYLSTNYYLTEFVVTDGSQVEGLMVKDIVNHANDNYISSKNLSLSDKKLAELQLNIANVKEAYVDTAMINGLHFKLKIFDNNVNMSELQRSMISLVASNKTVQKLNEQKRTFLTNKIATVSKEISLIDSLQILMLKNSEKLTINTTDFTGNLLDLNEYKDDLQGQLSRISTYETLRAIYKPQKPERTLVSAIVFGVILGFFLGVITGVILRLKKLSNERKSI